MSEDVQAMRVVWHLRGVHKAGRRVTVDVVAVVELERVRLTFEYSVGRGDDTVEHVDAGVAGQHLVNKATRPVALAYVVDCRRARMRRVPEPEAVIKVVITLELDTVLAPDMKRQAVSRV